MSPFSISFGQPLCCPFGAPTKRGQVQTDFMTLNQSCPALSRPSLFERFLRRTQHKCFGNSGADDCRHSPKSRVETEPVMSPFSSLLRPRRLLGLRIMADRSRESVHDLFRMWYRSLNPRSFHASLWQERVKPKHKQLWIPPCDHHRCIDPDRRQFRTVKPWRCSRRHLDHLLFRCCGFGLFFCHSR